MFFRIFSFPSVELLVGLQIGGPLDTCSQVQVQSVSKDQPYHDASDHFPLSPPVSERSSQSTAEQLVPSLFLSKGLGCSPASSMSFINIY